MQLLLKVHSGMARSADPDQTASSGVSTVCICHFVRNFDVRLLYLQFLFQNASLNVIQQEWFKVTSLKLSEAHQVEDYLSCFNELSRRLLEYIVNMQDANVSHKMGRHGIDYSVHFL